MPERWKILSGMNNTSTNIFSFLENNEPAIDHHTPPCSICGVYVLDYVYVRIIESLKKAGLLDKDYLLKCCRCYKDGK